MTGDYPKGDGQPDCGKCLGRGVVPVPSDRRPKGSLGELTQPCSCVLSRTILANLDRGWKGISKARPLPGSPLYGKINQNLWITGSILQLRQHIRHVAVRMGPYWNFQVVSDAVMMDAWLSLDVSKVWDPDIEAIRQTVSNRYARLSDLVDPADLLIIQLGVKAARNKAMPEVFLEALNRRYLMQQDKPTWVMDQPVYPLTEGHISYNDRIAELLSTWEHIELGEGQGGGGGPDGGAQMLLMGSENTDPWENQVGDLDTSVSDKKKWGGKR